MGTAEAIAAVANLISVAIEALQAASQANTVLMQAQSEGWTDADPRWAQPFADLDAALAKAKARLT